MALLLDVHGIMWHYVGIMGHYVGAPRQLRGITATTFSNYTALRQLCEYGRLLFNENLFALPAVCNERNVSCSSRQQLSVKMKTSLTVIKGNV